MKPNPVQKSILKTLAFFDVLDRPMTLEQIHLYLYEGTSNLAKLRHELKNLHSTNTIGHLGDWYFLPGRVKFLDEYKSLDKHSQELFQTATKQLAGLKNIPFLNMVGITNSVALKVANDASDIDIFVVSANKRLYTARFFLVMYLKLKGLYMTDEKPKQGKICASFYTDRESMDLSSLAIEHDQDIYLDYWLISLVPIYGKDIYGDFLKDNQKTTKKFGNFTQELKYKVDGWLYNPSENKSWWTKAVEWSLDGRIGDWSERRLRGPQIKHIKDLGDYKKPDSICVLGNTILKLHYKDKRQRIRLKYQEKLRELGLTEM
jgi:hypothetical protein